jgi:uncharacterized protein (TIGR04255 family)
VDSTRIQPVGGDHAIEVMAIGVEWIMPPVLSDEQIAALQAVYESSPAIREFLPTLAPVQTFLMQGANQFGVAGPDGNLKLEPQNFQAPQFIARNGGFDARRFDTKGNVAWVASIRPEFISINCSAYDRWKNVKAQALSILLPFVEAAVAKGVRINAIGLQYQDAFKLLDGASAAVTGDLFRKDGRYLPTSIFEQPYLWHCNQGWFSTSPDGRRVLNSVATDMADVGGIHFARIGGQHRVFAHSLDGTTPTAIAAKEIDEALQFLHNENIKVINGILSDGALKAIGCTVGGT